MTPASLWHDTVHIENGFIISLAQSRKGQGKKKHESLGVHHSLLFRWSERNQKALAWLTDSAGVWRHCCYTQFIFGEVYFRSVYFCLCWVFVCGLSSHCCEQGLFTLSCSGMASHWGGFSYHETGSRVSASVVSAPRLEHRLNSCGAQGWVARLHVGSSQFRDWTHISCIGRWSLYYLATREAP